MKGRGRCAFGIGKRQAARGTRRRSAGTGRHGREGYEDAVARSISGRRPLRDHRRRACPDSAGRRPGIRRLLRSPDRTTENRHESDRPAEKNAKRPEEDGGTGSTGRRRVYPLRWPGDTGYKMVTRDDTSPVLAAAALMLAKDPDPKAARHWQMPQRIRTSGWSGRLPSTQSPSAGIRCSSRPPRPDCRTIRIRSEFQPQGL